MTGQSFFSELFFFSFYPLIKVREDVDTIFHLRPPPFFSFFGQPVKKRGENGAEGLHIVGGDQDGGEKEAAKSSLPPQQHGRR